MVTIPPLAEFVEEVGRERVSATIMIPKNANPHTYEPTPAKLKELKKAQLYVKVGSGIEFELVWLEKILKLNSQLKLCDASLRVPLLAIKEPSDDDHDHHHQADHDPHIWNSLQNATLMVSNIRDALIELDPPNEFYYRKNAHEYILKLKKLKKELTVKLKRVKQRKFMVFHPAFAYLADEFLLKEIAIEASGKEPSLKELLRIIKKARQDKIKVIFAQPQFSSKSAQVIAEEIEGKVIFVDPLAKNYLTNMSQIADTLLKYLR